MSSKMKLCQWNGNILHCCTIYFQKYTKLTKNFGSARRMDICRSVAFICTITNGTGRTLLPHLFLLRYDSVSILTSDIELPILSRTFGIF